MTNNISPAGVSMCGSQVGLLREAIALPVYHVWVTAVKDIENLMGAKRYFYLAGRAWKRGRVASDKIRGDKSARSSNTCPFQVNTRCENDTAMLYNFLYFEYYSI